MESVIGRSSCEAYNASHEEIEAFTFAFVNSLSICRVSATDGIQPLFFFFVFLFKAGCARTMTIKPSMTPINTTADALFDTISSTPGGGGGGGLYLGNDAWPYPFLMWTTLML